ncbi:hypothetical protein [Saccharopolyspora elongata]|uniref:Uncharacterized protein n=1 Tax=Saccharopolyspora elongata TaxID=2530387 RepID=A0A4R4ZG45_9PSEU|nr:hypothetical protein [Saccharopolyspora elongata]TDD56594.1 hypothetical protein E1288_00440 [Saccharopolyspora elongata]
MNANLPVGMQRNTPAVARLKKLGETLDQLYKELIRVEFLEDDIMQKKDFEEAVDLAEAACSAVFGVRDAVAKRGGPNVAKGYQK